MASTQRKKGVQQWCITLNFPKKVQGDCKIPNQKIVKQIIANVNRKPHKTIYIRWTTQVGDKKGTTHLQMYLQCTKPMQLDQVKKFYFKDCEGISPFIDRQRSPTAIKADEYLDGPTCVKPPTTGTSICGKDEPCKYCNTLWTQKNFDKVIWTYKYGDRDDNLAPAPGQGKRTDLDKLLEVRDKIKSGEWSVSDVHNNVPHLMGKGVSIQWWLAKASSTEQSILMKPTWNDDPMKDKTMTQILKYINTTQDNRSILWIWSNAGRTGKSTMLTWMANKLKMMGREVFTSSGGKDSDIAHLYNEEPYCFFDFPRSEVTIPYSFIEQLKNGNVTSTKYQTKSKKPRDRHGVLKFPWVIVVANQGPSMERLSKDRCKVICLDQSGHHHDAPVVPDQEHRIIEQEPETWNELAPVAEVDLVDWKWVNPLEGKQFKVIDKSGEHGKKEEKKRLEDKVQGQEDKVQGHRPGTKSKDKEHKNEDSDDDSEFEVTNDYPPNRSIAPSPKGLLKEVRDLIDKKEIKRGDAGIGLGGGPPPQRFNTMMRSSGKKPDEVLIEGKWVKMIGKTPNNSDDDVIDLTDDKPIKKKPIKRTLINKKRKLPSTPTTPDHPDRDEEDTEWSQTELLEVQAAQEEAAYDEVLWAQAEHDRMLRQAATQKVKEVDAAEEAAYAMAALISDKKAKAKEKLASKHLDLKSRLAKED